MGDVFNKENYNVFTTSAIADSWRSKGSVSPQRVRRALRLHPCYRSPLSRSPIPFNLHPDTEASRDLPLPPIQTSSSVVLHLSSPGGTQVESPTIEAMENQVLYREFISRNVESAEIGSLEFPLQRTNPGTQTVPSATEEGSLHLDASHGGINAEPASFCVAERRNDDPCDGVGPSESHQIALGDDKGGNGNAFPELLSGELPWLDDHGQGCNEGLLLSEIAIQGRILDEEYLTSCRFYHHDPRRPLPTNLDILFKLGNLFGPGVTRSELRQTLRRCKACRRFMYADLRGSHRCDAAPSSTQQQDLVTALLSHDENSGFASQDLRSELTICNWCDHLMQTNVLRFHSCGAM